MYSTRYISSGQDTYKNPDIYTENKARDFLGGGGRGVGEIYAQKSSGCIINEILRHFPVTRERHFISW